jgi:hypothetical protein
MTTAPHHIHSAWPGWGEADAFYRKFVRTTRRKVGSGRTPIRPSVERALYIELIPQTPAKWGRVFTRFKKKIRKSLPPASLYPLQAADGGATAVELFVGGRKLDESDRKGL